jgi:hypothetical protein
MSRKRTPEGRRGVEAYTAVQLHQFLVADAVKGHATFLPWAVAAYERIGSVEQIGAEAAYRRVLAEVESLTGRGMPVDPPATRDELRRLGI